jgi:hypothetical protein
MSPVAKLGGPGETTPNSTELLALRPAIEQALTGNRRSPPLVMALLDPALVVHAYLQERTGQRSYFTEDEFALRKDQGLWKRLERVETQEGFTTETAISTGLCDGELDDLEAACSRAGLTEIPESLASSGLVHWVEELGRRTWVSYLLLFIGILALSIESGSPGIGVPGFIATICLGGYIWINYLNGTAEWLEILLLLCGIGCLAIELLVLPGFGVFGIGGIIMIVSSLILISQTFVLPQNEHQYLRTTRGLVAVLIATAGAVSGLVVLTHYFSRTPGLKNLMMPEADSEEIRERETRESLSNLDRLIGMEGFAVTPLVPSGKVRFGDELIAVVADGIALDPGTRVKVKVVQGTRVIVEPI